MSAFQLNYKNSDTYIRGDTRQLSFKTTGGLSFQRVWSLKNPKAKMALVLFLSFCSGCLNFFFVERVALYNPGLLSVWQSIGRCIKGFVGTSADVAYLILFWVFNSVINLVLALCTYRVIGKEMTRLSVLFIVGSSATGLILSYLPKDWGFKEFFLFSNPFGASNTQEQNGKNFSFLVWENVTQTTEGNTSLAKSGIIILFIYAIVFSFLNALITSLLYALGGCGGGVDWVIFYLFRAKSYFANKLIFYTSFCFCTFSYITGSYIPWAVNGGSGGKQFKELLSNFFSPLFFALLIALFVRRFIFNVFYPRFRFINVKIFTNKFLEIRNELINRKFPHSFTIVPSFGSYSLRSQAQLEFICLLIELQELTKVVRKIDQNCFICSIPIRSLNARIEM